MLRTAVSWFLAPTHCACTVILMFGAVAASAQPKERERNEAGEMETILAERTPGKTAWKGDLPELQKRRVIRVLVPHNRTFFFYDGLQPRGLAYEFMNEFGETLNAGKTTNERIYMLFLPTSRDRFVSDVANGYGDIALAGLTVTPSREKQVDFIPYNLDMNEIVVTGPGAPPLASLESLSGHTVFVRRSSSYYESLMTLNARFEALEKPGVKIKLAEEHLEDEDILELTHAGVVAITVVDQYMAELWAPVLHQLHTHPDLIVRKDARVGPILRKGSAAFSAALTAFIKSHGPGTSFGNVILQRYTRDNRWIRNPRTTDDLRRFKEAVPFFKQYAKQYEFDYLLIAAQAYQESRINQKLKSSAGAVGVMQIKPTTAADPNVSITDVHSMQANIHAGVKYLRFISDRYFSDNKFDDLNRHLFAFAAYNAGPARIQQLRTKAGKQGLDPNQWFNNVEIVAGREVGRETVDYVRNILKYWVAYRLALDPELDAPGDPRKMSAKDAR